MQRAFQLAGGLAIAIVFTCRFNGFREEDIGRVIETLLRNRRALAICSDHLFCRPSPSPTLFRISCTPEFVKASSPLLRMPQVSGILVT